MDYLPLATLLFNRHKNKIRLQSLAHKAVRGGNNKTLENLHSPIEYLILEVSGGKKEYSSPGLQEPDIRASLDSRH